MKTSERYQQLKVEILEYERQKIQKFRLQNRIDDIACEMEVPNKNFFKKCLDKKKSTTITALQTKDGEIISDPYEILDMVHQFYSSLWSSKKNICENEQDEYLSYIRQIFCVT